MRRRGLRIVDRLLPPTVVALPALDDRRDTVARWLDGLHVPEPVDVAFAWAGPTGAGPLVEVPVPTFATDDEADAWTDAGGVIIPAADQHVPDLDERAAGILADLDRLARVPGPWSWRRWSITYRIEHAVGWLGCGPRLSCYSGDRLGGYLSGPVRWVWPVYRSRWTCDGEPRTTWRARHTLGREGWWWECLRRQARHPWHRWHRPEHPWALGICGACAPCPECGAAQDCRPGCTLGYGCPACGGSGIGPTGDVSTSCPVCS